MPLRDIVNIPYRNILRLCIVHGHFVKNDGKKRLKPGTSNQFLSRVEWAKWQHDEAVLRLVTILRHKLRVTICIFLSFK